jgi:hypothetical protein
MNRKTFSLLAILFLSQTALAQQQSSQVGRYQMMEATLSAPPDAAAKQAKRLVILDTITGTLTTCDYVYNDVGKKKEDGREYWGANGICSPFGTQQGWYIPKAAKR